MRSVCTTFDMANSKRRKELPLHIPFQIKTTISWSVLVLMSEITACHLTVRLMVVECEFSIGFVCFNTDSTCYRKRVWGGWDWEGALGEQWKSNVFCWSCHYSAHGRPLQLAGTVGSRPIPLHQLPLGEADGSQTGGDPESVSLAPWLHLCARVCALFIEEGMKSRIDHARWLSACFQWELLGLLLHIGRANGNDVLEENWWHLISGTMCLIIYLENMMILYWRSLNDQSNLNHTTSLRTSFSCLPWKFSGKYHSHVD